jgi:hypothetical protein
MKKYVLIIFLIQSIPLLSQYAITGIVKRYSSNRIVPFTAVFVDTICQSYYGGKQKLVGKTTADINGKFRMDNIPVDKVNLILSYIGFETLMIENIKLEKDSILDIGVLELLVQGQDVIGHKPIQGNIKNRYNKIDREIKFRYPCDGKRIKMKIVQGYVLINYDEFKQSRK